MRGRTCLNCGHVMMFLSENQLSQLRQKIGGLAPQPPHPQD
jgi:hypothetical protein